MTDLVLGIRLTIDGKEVSGEIRGQAAELEKLGKAAAQSNQQARSSSDQFVASLKKQADTIGMTRTQTLGYEASQQKLTTAQRENVAQSIKAIEAHERHNNTLRDLKVTAAAAGAILGSVLVAGLKGALAQTIQAEQASLRLAAVLRATGNAAGLSKDELDEMAESMKQRFGVADDEIRKSMAVLLLFGNVSRETFGPAIEMGLNLSKVLGIDVQSAIMMMGRALQDPEQGLVALQRATRAFNDDQREMLKRMAESGRQAEAMALILKILKEKGFEGVAESMNKGLAAASNKVALAWNDMLLSVGKSQTFLDIAHRSLLLIERALRAIEYFANIDTVGRAVSGKIKGATPPIKASDFGGMSELEFRLQQLREQLAYFQSHTGKDSALEGQKKFVESLIAEAETLGMTAGEIALYKARLLELPPALQEAAKWAINIIETRRQEIDATAKLSARLEALSKAEQDETALLGGFVMAMSESSKASALETQQIVARTAALGQSETAQRALATEQAIAVELLKLEKQYYDALNQAGDDNLALQRRITDEYIRRRTVLPDEVRALNVARDAQKALEETRAEAKKLDEDLQRGITDALMRGFESGKDFARNFRDTLVNMFKTLVLRPIIKWVVSPLSGAITATLAGLGIPGVANAAGGGMNLLSGGSSAFNLFGGFGADYALGASYGAAMLEGGGVLTLGTQLGAQAAATFGSTIAVALPYVGIALAAASMLGLFGGSKKIPATSLGDMGRSYGPGGAVLSQYSGPYDTGAGGDTLDKLYAQYAAAAGLLGVAPGAASFYYGANTGRQGADPQFRLSGGAGGRMFDTGETMQRTDANIANAAARAVLTALQGSELPGYMRKFFDSLVADNLDAAAINNAIAFGASLKAIREQLTNTPLELATLHVTQLNAALGASATTVEAWKTQFVGAIDAGTNPQAIAQWQALGQAIQATTDIAAQAAEQAAQAAEQAAQAQQRILDDSRSALLDAYDRESSALTQTRDRMLGFVDSMKSFRDALLLGDLSPLSPEARYAESRRQFEDISRRAQLGDMAAMDQLQGVSQGFLAASRGYNASNAQYAADFDAVMRAAGATQSVAERQAGIQTAQLDVMRNQLSALGVINESVLSVAQALATYLKASGSTSPIAGTVGGVRSAINEFGSRTGIGDTGYTISGNTLYFPGGGSHTVGGADAAATLIRTYGLIAAPDGTFLRTRALGGFTAAGWALTGERGPELVNFSAPSRVYTAPETRAALAGGDGKETVAQLKATVSELQTVVRVLSAGLSEQIDATDRVNKKLDDVTRELWRARSQPRRTA